MSGKIRKGIILIFAVIFIWGINQNSYGAGTTGLNFLKMNIGSRAQGMGSAFTGIANDINAPFYNPAGIAFVLRPAVMFYHSRWIEDISVENLSALYPFGNKITLSGGITYLHLPDIEGYDIDPSGNPVPAGSFRVYDFLGSVNFGYRVSWDFSVGLQLKYIQERIDDVTASGIAFDIGALYKTPLDFLSIGVAFQNIGPKIKYEAYKEKLPFSYRLGLAYQLPEQAVTFAVDACKTVDEKVKIYSGIEVEFMDMMALRGGYQFQTDVGDGYSLGMGLKLMDQYRMNYVFAPYGILGNTHRVEIVFNFGGIKTRVVPEKKIQKIPERKEGKKQTPSAEKSKAEELPVPGGLRAVQAGKNILLSWNSSRIPDINYNIYVKIPGKTGIVKINKTPLQKNRYTFTPKVNSLDLVFYVSMVYRGQESKLSEPLEFKYEW